MLALSKADLVPAEAAERGGRAWREALGEDVPVLVTSSATRAGLAELARCCCARSRCRRRARRRSSPPYEELAEHRVFRPGGGPRVVASSAARASSSASPAAPIERLFARFDVENEEALAHVERRLKRMGVIRALEEAGFQPGDDVEIAGHRVRARPS